MKLITYLSMGAAIVLASACTVKTSSSGLPGLSDPPGPTGPLSLSSTPLAGKVDGADWKSGPGIATQNSDGTYSIQLTAEGTALSCDNPFLNAPTLMFSIPNKTGTLSFDLSQGLRGTAVNLAYPAKPGSDGTIANIIADKDTVEIDSIGNGIVSGKLAAVVADTASHSYNVDGQFQAKICGSFPPAPIPTTPPVANGNSISVLIFGAPAFQVAYTEVVKLVSADGSLSYQLRLMDRTPNKPCNSFEAWMNEEAPIKYFTVPVPAALGTFRVLSGTSDYGNQGASSGFDYNDVSGTGSVQVISAANLAVHLNVNDLATGGVSIQGDVTAPICQ